MQHALHLIGSSNANFRGYMQSDFTVFMASMYLATAKFFNCLCIIFRHILFSIYNEL